VGVEKLFPAKFAKIKSCQDAPQTTFSVFLDIFYPQSLAVLKKMEFFNSHACLRQQPCPPSSGCFSRTPPDPPFCHRRQKQTVTAAELIEMRLKGDSSAAKLPHEREQ
jgi:hypothetical protein